MLLHWFAVYILLLQRAFSRFCMSLTTKILLVGPQNAGKTVLAKYIFSRESEDLSFLENTIDEKEFESFKLDLGSEGDVSTYPVRIHERNIDDFQVTFNFTARIDRCNQFINY